jgi:type I restriction enzyme M protein
MITKKDSLKQVLLNCRSIMVSNDKLSPDGIYDELSKILFLKNQHDHKCRMAGKSFSKEEFRLRLNNAPEEIRKELEDDRLAKEIKKVQIKQTSLTQIIDELAKFDLSEIPCDLKGKAYKEFADMALIPSLATLFTPLPIVDFMVQILDPRPGELVCDPCCGSGSFLVKTFLYLKEKFLKKPGDSNGQALAKDYLINMSNDCIFGVDANPRMAWASKLNMMMHGGGHEGIHWGDGLLNKRGVFDGRFDVVFANPPFGGRLMKDLTILPIDCMAEEEFIDYGVRMGTNAAELLRVVKNNIGMPIYKLFDLGKMTKLTEVLFMERCLRLLKPGGRMGIVLPEGVLNSDKFQEAREYVEGKAKLILIASLPKEAFRHLQVGVTAGIVFLKKFTLEEAAIYHRISTAAKEAVSKKFATEIGKAGRPVKSRKHDKQRKRELAARIKAEIRSIVKEEFDYEIPIVSIEKAAEGGIYGLDENHLHEIASEYTAYRKENKLWESSSLSA